MKNAAKWAGNFRHWLGIAGAALIAGDFVEAGMWDQFVGGVMAAVAMYSSWTSKAKLEGEGDPK